MKTAIRCVVLLAVLLALVGGTAGGPFGEQYKISGKDNYGYMGCSVAAVGDQDGDGYDDFIVGLYGVGLAKVLSGVDGSTIYELKGNGGDDFGWSVAGIPDFDGDGLPEFIVGTQYSDYVKVFTSSAGKEAYSIKGMNGGEYFGFSVAGIDDLDGDSLGDFAVGALYGYDTSKVQSGHVMVFSGSSGNNIYTVYGVNAGSNSDEFGCAVAGGADVDGDGYGDFAVGARYGYDSSQGTYPGYAMVFSGQAGKQIATFYGSTDYGYYGQSVAYAGDVNDDDYPDLVVGAPYDWNTPYGYYGVIQVISGADGGTIYTLYAGDTGATDYYLGWSVCGLGDFDGDGYDDFAAGGEYLVSPEGYWSGGARAWSGYDGSVLFTVHGKSDYVGFGIAICSLTDTSTGDFYGFVVGAPYDSSGGSNGGAVHLFKELEITGSVSINGGAPYTTSPDVTLYLAWTAPASTVKEVRV
ncbi:MAG: integrin alpha, partial [Planctomycetes bacterium]|nr:integrin alpha [Planctomycetota bacterium]